MPEGGYRLWTEHRPASIFALSASSHPAHYMRLAGRQMDWRVLDDEAEGIARELVEQWHDGIRYLCQFGPPVLQPAMDHPELLHQTQPPVNPLSIETIMLAWEPIFYALALLHQCAFEYLRTIPSLDMEDSALAARLADELTAFAQDTECAAVARVPLAGIEIGGPSIGSRLCSIERLTSEELGQLFSERQTAWVSTKVAHSLPASMDGRRHLTERVVLEVRQHHPKGVYFTPAIQCQKVLLAMHIVGVQYAGSGHGAMLQEPLWVHPEGRSFYPLRMPGAFRPGLHLLDDRAFDAILALAGRIPDSAVTTPQSPADLALGRMAMGMSRLEPRESLIDYVVALEALLLSGSEMGEMRRTFALNGAAFTASSHRERMHTYRELCDIYSARSALVHGTNPKRLSKVLDNVPTTRDQAQRIASLAVRRALESGWPAAENFIAALLDDAPALEGTLPSMSAQASDTELTIDGVRYRFVYIPGEPHASAYEVYRYEPDAQSWANTTDYVLVRDYPGNLIAIVHPPTDADRPLRHHGFGDDSGLSYVGAPGSL